MDIMDKMLQKFADDAATVVEPVYDEVRAKIHARMKVRSALRFGAMFTVGMAIVAIAWWSMVAPHGYPLVHAGSGSFAGGPESVESIQAAPTPPKIILNPSAGSVATDVGHKVPVQMYVNHNDEAVDQMIADNSAIAQAAQNRGDFRQAAVVYMDLARTLDLHGRDNNVQWAIGKAIEMAGRTSDAKLMDDAAALKAALMK